MKRWLNKIDRVDVLPRPGGIDLRYSEWTQSLPADLFKKFVKTLTWEDFALYPDTNILKQKLASHHYVTPLNIYLGPGSAECISNVFECYSEFQNITTTDPCFPMYDVYASQNNLSITKVLPREDLSYNVDEMAGNNFVIVSRPSNPTGYFFTRKDIIKLLEQDSNRWVLVDEAYIDYVENRDDIVDLISAYDNLIISRSFSKVFGAAGCRIGYLLSHSKNIDFISKLRPMYEITGPSQRYAMFLLDNQSEIEKYCNRAIEERKKLCKLFRSAKLEVIESQGNWIHVQQEDWLISCLEDNDIHVKKNTKLPFRSGLWLRITVGPGIRSLIKKIL